jgi:hypothetical protein
LAERERRKEGGLFVLLYFRNGRPIGYNSAKAQEAVDHLASFLSSREEIS